MHPYLNMCGFNTVTGGPAGGENLLTTETQCCETIALMKHTTDEAITKENGMWLFNCLALMSDLTEK